MKAIKFALNYEGDYNYYFDNVTPEILDRFPDGYFDDNGDLPAGNCVLIPLKDIKSSSNLDLEQYQVVDVEIFENEELDEDGRFLSVGDYWMGWTSIGLLISGNWE